ncbi:hypothetical protein WJX81_000790 [Elliptochloris bilobata]|uniref:ATP synthase mitochondrial F1 complex assembly factor 2 n=1 Tax=Elliptochloris bilobata TaxID=381761 RepID=A0AAW1RFC4_9CHLO
MLPRMRAARGAAQLFSDVHPWACSAAASQLVQARGEASTVRRWYERVTVAEQQGLWHVFLDARALRTPARHTLAVPSRALALAIAAEWQWQEPGRIRPITMPLMSIAATAIDQPKPRAAVIDAMLQYVHTDAACCRHEPGALADRQAQVFDPVLEWAGDTLRAAFTVDDSIFAANQPEAAIQALRQHLEGLDAWHLTAVEFLASSCRSVLLGLAVLHARLGVAEAVDAARLEEASQIEEWGLVEGGHDIDLSDLKVRMAAPSVFLRLLRMQSPPKSLTCAVRP